MVMALWPILNTKLEKLIMATKAQNLPNCRNAPKLVHLRRFLRLESFVLSLVSCFLYICRGSITFVVRPLQIAHFMQNKPNFQKDQMNVNMVLTRAYDKKTPGERGKNKPNSNPIQTQSNPIKANKMPKQTQYKPKQTQFLSQKLLLILTLLEVLATSIITSYYLEQHGSLNRMRLP